MRSNNLRLHAKFRKSYQDSRRTAVHALARVRSRAGCRFDRPMSLPVNGLSLFAESRRARGYLAQAAGELAGGLDEILGGWILAW